MEDTRLSEDESSVSSDEDMADETTDLSSDDAERREDLIACRDCGVVFAHLRGLEAHSQQGCGKKNGIVLPMTGKDVEDALSGLTPDIPKMARMSREKSESLNFYRYLCQKIGSEEVLKIRRLNSTIRDIGDGRKFKITSGSRGEGLYLESSDFDIMFIHSFPKVYQSQEEVVHDNRTTHLIMNTEETPPCYTQLCILNTDVLKENLLIKTHLGYMLSSEQFKHNTLSTLPRKGPVCYMKIHGPCISDTEDIIDIAYCFKCDQWVFNVMNIEKLTTILQNLYEQGIACFIFTDTLQYCQKQSYKITESLNVNVNLVLQQSPPFMPISTDIHLLCHLLHTYLHHSKTGLSKALFASQLSKTCRFAPDDTDHLYNTENKQQYIKYKSDISHLLIGLQADAVSGWLKLASFFYVHKHYFASLSVIHYALHCKNIPISTRSELTRIQKHELNLMKKEKLYTVLKALSISPVHFYTNSYLIPLELQMKDTYVIHIYYPLAFGHLLNFLCNCHLQDIASCRSSLQQLESITRAIIIESHDLNCLPIFCGIAYNLMDKPDLARQMFQPIAEHDSFNVTGAVSRLSHVISHCPH
ncbi:unnamed protein product [Mytilus edulis]|uniref:Uncharacterized protein n=1 Tax=Mytilus edulis TaxID=6550 RepID=A0A8S3QSJ1_MYTED|nr:unnamed protein product [Mytilus edulis]